MPNDSDQTQLVADIVSAYVSNNSVPVSELAALMGSVYAALQRVASGSIAPAEQPVAEPAVPVKKSVTREFIICLEDGKKSTSLRRHLASKYGMTPEDHRAKWGLSATYPMVAPAYSEKRSALAKQSGLGQKAAPAAAKRATRKKAA